jgi:hypothetical protein
VAVLAVPQPYDFERSLDRFTFWGVDRANVWQDGGLHRVIGGREIRIEAANLGVRVEPRKWIERRSAESRQIRCRQLPPVARRTW